MIDFEKFLDEFHEEEGQFIQVDENSLVFQMVDIVEDVTINIIKTSNEIWNRIKEARMPTQQYGLVKVQ